MPKPELIAHRGYAAAAPENTLEAIDAALRVGARYLEVDVQMTADQVPVLFHDANLMRLCAAPKAIRDYRLAELAACRVDDRERFGGRLGGASIPTLSDLVTHLLGWPEATVFVEIKAECFCVADRESVYDRVAAILRPIGRRAIPISFDLELLSVARRRGCAALGAVVDRWANLDDPRLDDLRPEYVFTNLDHLPAEGLLGRPGSRLAVYEVADPVTALALAGRGADLIETFAIGEMLRDLWSETSPGSRI